MNKIIISSIKMSRDAPGIEYFTRIGGKLKIYVNTTELLADRAQLVSFDWDSLVLWLSQQGEQMPLDIIDIEQAAKQLIGRKKTIEKNAAWNIWEILAPFYQEVENEVFVRTQRVYYGLTEVIEAEKCQLYDQLLIAMEACYNNLLTDLKNKGEFERFYNVERPIRIINLDRTFKGISIDTENVSEWINKLSYEYYGYKNALQLGFGIVASQDRTTVFLKMEEKGLLAEAKVIIEEKGYYFFLKDSRLRDPLIETLYREKKSGANLNVLLSIGALQPRYQQIHPVFDSLGTITARTKMVTPNLQHLTKKYRSIVKADQGKELRYIDYVQFEAGILANDSGDQQLIMEYNESDIYYEIGKRIDVAKYLSDSENQRNFCKNLFYKYAYGMDIKNHIGVLKDFQLEFQKETLSPLIISAFESYKTLNEYRKKIKEKALNDNQIGTHQGNFRYRMENENNVSWAISQRIQGTASLILKKAIIRLRKKDKEIDFLMPMHDAALFQIPKEKSQEKEGLIKSIFEEVFKEECPLINPAAKFKPFCE